MADYTPFVTDNKGWEPTPEEGAPELQKISPSTESTIRAEVQQYNPMFQLSRAAERGQYESSGIDQFINTLAGVGGTKPSPQIDAKTANEKYAPQGQSITDKPIAEGLANVLGQQKTDQIRRESVINRYENNHNWETNFAVGTAAFLLDPLNVSTMLIPGIGEEAALARFGEGIGGRIAARALSGASAGAMGQVPLTALRYGLSKEDQTDYGIRDAARDLVYGAAGGAFLGATVGTAFGEAGRSLREKYYTTNPEVNHAAMSSAVSQTLDGRPVDVEPIFTAEAALGPARDLSEASRKPVQRGLGVEQGEGTTEQLKPLSEAVEGLKKDSSINQATELAENINKGHNAERLAEEPIAEPLGAGYRQSTNLAEAINKEHNYTPAEVAQKQQELYREGYDPGLSQKELVATTEEMYPKEPVKTIPVETKYASGETKTSTVKGPPADPELDRLEQQFNANKDKITLTPEEQEGLRQTAKFTRKGSQSQESNVLGFKKPEYYPGVFGDTAVKLYNELSLRLHGKYGDGIRNKATKEENSRLTELDKKAQQNKPSAKEETEIEGEEGVEDLFDEEQATDTLKAAKKTQSEYAREYPSVGAKLKSLVDYLTEVREGGSKWDDTKINHLTSLEKDIDNQIELIEQNKAEPNKNIVELKNWRKSAQEQTRPFGKRGFISSDDVDKVNPIELDKDTILYLVKNPTAGEQRLIDQISAIAKKIVPEADLRFARRIDLGDETRDSSGTLKGYESTGLTYINGVRNLIALSLRSPDIRGTLYHEVIHWLRANGFFTEEEWKVLRKTALERDWQGQFDIEKKYPNADPWLKEEEAIAFGHSYSLKHPDWLPEDLKPIFDKFNLLLAQIKDHFKKMFGADLSAEDIFSRISSGEIAKRGPQPGGEAEYQRGAAQEAEYQKSSSNVKIGADLGRLIKIFGPKMYGNNISEVTVKELLQNVFDSVKEAYNTTPRNKGDYIRSPRPLQLGEGKVDIHYDADNKTIKFIDNGIGMSPDIVRERFLTIAGSEKGGLAPEEASGGFGIAKLAFIFGNKGLELDTVRDGVRTTMKTTPQELLDGTAKLDTSDTTDEDGTNLKILLPEKYADPNTGELKDTSLPYSVGRFEALRNPLIGDIKVNAFDVKHYGMNEPSLRHDPDIKIGVDHPLYGKEPTTKVHFPWGTIDVYQGTEHESGHEWRAEHNVLSAGIHQFSHAISKPGNSYDKLPTDYTFNVKPNVGTDHPLYPFNNQRENWSPKVAKDISQLESYLKREYQIKQANKIGSTFATVETMGKDGLFTPVDLSSHYPKTETAKGGLPKNLKIKNGKTVIGGKEVDINEKEPIKNIDIKDFKYPKDAVPSGPLFHNNLNTNIIDKAESDFGIKSEDSRAFFSDLGHHIEDFKQSLSKLLDYEKWSNPNHPVGISLDKDYHGVHIKVPYDAFFLNPLSVRVNSPGAIAASWMHTLMHEAVHTRVSGHSETFTTELARIEGAFEELNPGKKQELQNSLLNLINKFKDNFDQLRKIYNDPNTENVSKTTASTQGRLGQPGQSTGISGRSFGDGERGQLEPGVRQGSRGNIPEGDAGIDFQSADRDKAEEDLKQNKFGHNLGGEISEEQLAEHIAAMNQRKDILRNAITRNDRVKEVDEAGGVEKAYDTISSWLHFVPSATNNNSIESQWHGLSKAWRATVGNQLRLKGLEKVALSGQLDDQISEAWWRLNGGKPNDQVQISKPAQQIAEIFHPAAELAKNRLNGAGSHIGDALDYVTHTRWDPRQLRSAAGKGANREAAFEAWRTKDEPRMSDKTFEHLKPEKGETIEEAKTRFLKSVWDARTSGVSITRTDLSDDGNGYIPIAYEGTYNVARRVGQQRTIFWKDSQAWNDHMKDFGGGQSLYAALDHTLEQSARQTSLMTKLGTNPVGNLNAIIQKIKERYRDSDGLKAFEGKLPSLLTKLSYLDGTANIPVNETKAAWEQAVLNLEVSSRAGGIAIPHLTSASMTISSELIHHGQSRFDAFGHILKAITSGRGTEEAQQALSEAGAYANGYSLAMRSYKQSGEGIPGWISWRLTQFMKMTTLPHFLDKLQANAIKSVIMSHLGGSLDKPFDQLHPSQSAVMQRYGIGSDEWNLIRNTTGHVMDGNRILLSPDSANRISDNDVSQLLESRGIIKEDSTPEQVDHIIQQFKWELGDHYLMYLNDASERGTITPGVKEQATVLGGARPGTAEWFLRRSLGQFKMWPLAAWNQIINRDVAFSLSTSKMAVNFGWILALSTAAGAARLAINDMINGRPQRDYTDGNNLLTALGEGGGLGIYGDVLFGAISKASNYGLGDVMGPVYSDIETLLKTYNQFRIDEDSATPDRDGRTGFNKAFHHALPEVMRFGLQHIPASNLFYLKGAIDYMAFYHMYEAASPGWWERTNRRMEKEQGKTMMGYTPGQPIPYGIPGIYLSNQQ